MAKELDIIAAQTPIYVVEALKGFRKKYNLIELENPEGLLYELRAREQEKTVDYLTNQSGQFDRDKFELAVIAVMVDLRKNIIR